MFPFVSHQARLAASLFFSIHFPEKPQFQPTQSQIPASALAVILRLSNYLDREPGQGPAVLWMLQHTIALSKPSHISAHLQNRTLRMEVYMVARTAFQN
jgi:hypothetical protein